MKPPRPLLLVAQKLGPLRERVVFVGGMIRGLLSTDPAAGPARPTDDVDLIVDVPTLVDYHMMITTLRPSGFQEDTREGAPLCRFRVEGITADIMPVDPAVLGFSNVWYESALRHVSTIATEEGTLRHLDAPHFCATKLEAFASRGDGDFYHHDLEDFIATVDERAELIDEIGTAPPEVREFLATTTGRLLATPAFVEALRGHLSADEVGDQRLPGLRAKLKRIAALAEQGTIAPGDAAPQARSSRSPGPPRRSEAPATSSSGTFGGLPGFTSRSPGQRVGAATGRVQVQSSSLNWVEYDAAQQALTVEFTRGTVYRYANVPPPVYSGLLAAYSKGRYFHVWIRDRYANTKLG